MAPEQVADDGLDEDFGPEWDAWDSVTGFGGTDESHAREWDAVDATGGGW